MFKFISETLVSYYNGTSSNKIARLNTDGTLDNSFVIGTGFNQSVEEIAVQTDGKILVGGDFTTYNGASTSKIARLNTDGTLDNSFVIGTGLDQSILTIALQTDGKILVGGKFTLYNGSSVNRIARLNTDGTLDNSFTTGLGFNMNVWSIALQAEGKIIAGGSFSTYNGNSTNNIARLNTDGTLENSFTIGTGFTGGTFSIAVQSDGKILVGGYFTSFNGSSLGNFARLNTDGTLESLFAILTGFNNIVQTIVLQSDGKVLVGGYFTSFNGSTVNRIARLNTDGTLDNSFTIGTGFNGSTRSIAVQSDGKILVGGYYTSFNGSSVGNFVRLNTDGTLDNSFTIGTGFDSEVASIVLQPDGKILLGGSFISFNGSTVNRIARLNTDGTIDNSFTIGTGFNQSVHSIVLQADGKILLGGYFTSFNGSTVNRIARLNTDGTIDNSFTIGTGFSAYARSIALQSDGKILVGGQFSSFNGNPSAGIARLNTDGTLDNSFTIGTGFNQDVQVVVVQTDGKILLGGKFTSYNGSPVNKIARLNSNGTIDNSFTTGTGFNDQVCSIALQSDGNILAGGDFAFYNEIPRNKIVRLLNDTPLGVENLSATSYKLYPNPVTDVFTIESQGKVQQVTLYSITGQLLQTLTPQSNVIEMDVASYESGVYIVKIQNSNGNSTTNRVVKK